jgi:hypothetical protein
MPRLGTRGLKNEILYRSTKYVLLGGHKGENRPPERYVGPNISLVEYPSIRFFFLNELNNEYVASDLENKISALKR